MSNKVYMYSRFERFWHWTQALLFILMFYTGFQFHGALGSSNFELSVILHNTFSWALIILIAFAIFWHIITGEWKQYIFTLQNLDKMVKYYLHDIFFGLPHPTEKTQKSKLNPLQRIAYLQIKLFLIPIQLVSGLLYFFKMELKLNTHQLQMVAYVHYYCAIALLLFMIVHIYLTTTGHTIFSNIKAMITGWEDLDHH